ncbi:hypothetical protein AB0L26_33745 [Streptomyces nondiastaticus]|uniref:hypothetical protein n=1 Tax=Streptomyces nondiastaticus TaxID=3154512 RepID=UPI00344274D9
MDERTADQHADATADISAERQCVRDRTAATRAERHDPATTQASAPGRAVDLLQQHLATARSLQAAVTGTEVLRLAAAPYFGQALGERRRTTTALRPPARRTAVRDLRQALTGLLV